jgi:hypothetical protein
MKMKMGAFVFAVACATAMGSYTFDLQAQNQPAMSFFVTSTGSGDGANLGGLAGADKLCQTRAAAAGAGGRTWHAYLSAAAQGGQPAVNARDRIGKGPWSNAKGVVIAQSVADLHSDNNKISKETALDEKGMPVNARGETPNNHDILTGSKVDGTLATEGGDMTCNNWTSNSTGAAMLGHHDKMGQAGPSSWNAAHASKGCSQENLRGTGGAGLVYCFAVN